MVLRFLEEQSCELCWRQCFHPGIAIARGAVYSAVVGEKECWVASFRLPDLNDTITGFYTRLLLLLS